MNLGLTLAKSSTRIQIIGQLDQKHKERAQLIKLYQSKA
jgi:hypothetical protein